MLRTRQFICYSLVILCSLFEQCFSVSPPYTEGHPWFTGPLITPSARVVAVGHVNLEPYLYWTVTEGRYGDHWQPISLPKFYQWNPQLVFKAGIYEKFNLTGTIQSVYNQTRGRSASGFGDLQLGIDYQLLSGEEYDPHVKLSIQEIFPTGRYQKLNARKLGTDISGAGSYSTLIGIAISKLYHFSGAHYLNWRLFFTGTFFAPVHVDGLNAYGGDRTTRGKVFPGASFSFFAAGQYSLTENWALALDIVGTYSAKNRFKGHTIDLVGNPSSAQFSAAPAVEYNWSKNVGVIFGSWFTFAGRNTPRFVSAVGALNWYF